MTDREAAQILCDICGYLDLPAEILRHRVLSGWILMPPARVIDRTFSPMRYGAHPERVLGETHPTLLTEDH